MRNLLHCTEEQIDGLIGARILLIVLKMLFGFKDLSALSSVVYQGDDLTNETTHSLLGASMSKADDKIEL